MKNLNYILYPNNADDNSFNLLYALNKKSSTENLIFYLKAFCNELTKYLNITDLQKITVFEGIKNSGSFDYQNNEIKINSKKISFKNLPVLLNTICHEVYHVYQHQTEFNKTFDKSFNESKFEIIDTNIYNLNLFQDYDVYDYAFYYNSTIEKQARDFASLYCEKYLTKLQKNFGLFNKFTIGYFNYVKKVFGDIKTKQDYLYNKHLADIRKYQINNNFYKYVAYGTVKDLIETKAYTQNIFKLTGPLEYVSDKDQLNEIKSMAFLSRDKQLIEAIINSYNVPISKQELVDYIKALNKPSRVKISELYEKLYAWKKCDLTAAYNEAISTDYEIEK